MRYLSLSFYLINFKPWHNEPQVLRLIAMTFLREWDSLTGLNPYFSVAKEKKLKRMIYLLNKGL